MSRANSLVLLAAVVGISGAASAVYAQNDAQRREERNEERLEHREGDRGDYHQALDNLKQARHALATAYGDWDGRRHEALQQTNYAIEQVYAALGDDAAKAADQKVAAQELQTRERHGDRGEHVGIDQQRQQMRNALDHLTDARHQLANLPGGDTRRQKTLDFTDQAIKDVRTAMDSIH